ncbi:MAG: PIG-L deacetylase family protein [Candidatus Helarchaeota archaeon]
MNCKEHIVVFAAHPDDEGSAWATLYKYYFYRNRISIIWLTYGDKFIAPIGKFAHYLPDLIAAIYSKPARRVLAQQIVAIRKQEALKAAKIIRAKTYFLDFKDTRVPNYTDMNAVWKVTNLIRKIKPSIILTHFFREGHRDHKNTSALITKSVLLAQNKSYETDLPPHKVRIFGYWNERGHGFRPNFYINVERQIDQVKAWGACYESQRFRVVGRFAKLLARFNGRKTPYIYVEKFWIVNKKLVQNYGEFFP